jgi:hypothetical protein
MNKRKPTIRVVAEWIVGDSSVPDWLVRGLERYAPLAWISTEANHPNVER